MRNQVLIYIPHEADVKKFCEIISEFNVEGREGIIFKFMRYSKRDQFYFLSCIRKHLKVSGHSTNEINIPYKRLDSTSIDSLKIVPTEAWIQFITGL